MELFFRKYLSLNLEKYNSPTDPFTTFDLPNPSHDVPVKFAEAVKLGKDRSEDFQKRGIILARKCFFKESSTYMPIMHNS